MSCLGKSTDKEGREGAGSVRICGNAFKEVGNGDDEGPESGTSLEKPQEDKEAKVAGASESGQCPQDRQIQPIRRAPLHGGTSHPAAVLRTRYRRSLPPPLPKRTESENRALLTIRGNG